VSTASETASKGISDLASRARAITITSPPTSPNPDAPSTATDSTAENEETAEAHPDRPDSLPADIYKEASTSASSLASRFRAEAARRLKEAQKLEDAADEALLQWGTSLGAFLKDAVTIAPPSSEDVQAGRGEVLFASKDAEGRRVVHATRLDAQLHVIHCSLDSFLKDPKSAEWENWQKEFDVEKKTDEIKRDLERYEQLRQAMEKLVPEEVSYALFWTRYYFLRHVVETEEARRRELLKGRHIPFHSIPSHYQNWVCMSLGRDTDAVTRRSNKHPRRSRLGRIRRRRLGFRHAQERYSLNLYTRTTHHIRNRSAKSREGQGRLRQRHAETF
jgi:hypothetical protein